MKNNMVTLVTDFPVAINSLDHIHPWGTKNDNHTSQGLIEEVETYFGNRKINFMDMGCAGGQFAVDFHNRGHRSVGLEGSDYSLVNKRVSWASLANEVLFTCDVTKPFQLLNDSQPLKFDMITSWEVLEHIRRDDLGQVFKNVLNHLKDDGVFCASVSSSFSPVDNGVELHETILPKGVWLSEILPEFFNVEDYPFKNYVRPDVVAAGSSFHFLGRKKDRKIYVRG